MRAYDYKAVVLKLDPIELGHAAARVELKLNQLAKEGFRLSASHMDMDRDTPIALFIMERSRESEGGA